MYKRGSSKINVGGLTQKEDCRAYRVFEYYIRKLEQDLNLPDDSDEVFLFKPHQGGAQVYSCTSCSHDTAQMPKYDLFDGVEDDGTRHGQFTSIGRSSTARQNPPTVVIVKSNGTRYSRSTYTTTKGIGDEQKPELSCLNQDERLSLAVLKVKFRSLVTALCYAASITHSHDDYTHTPVTITPTPSLSDV